MTAADGRKQGSGLATDAEVLAAYQERFGIVLERVPTVGRAGS